MRSILIFAIFFALSSCGKMSAPQKQSMRMNISLDPSTLDPRKVHDLYGETVCRMLFEGLTRISKDGKPELALAEAVEVSEDGLEYVFHLRKSLWSNGEPVTSYDFAETWKTILSPNFPTDIAHGLYVIQNGKQVKIGETDLENLGVKTPDPSTLIVRLEEPIPYFFEICSMTSFLPVPRNVALENPNWTADKKTFVGNGPFLLKEWKHNDEILVSKNEKYWDEGSVQLNELSFVMVSSETEIQMFEDRQLDWAGSPLSALPIDAVKSLKQADKLKVGPLSGTHLLKINTKVLVSSEFRKALAYSIDRDEIAEHILQGGQTAARSLVPPEMGLYGDGYFSDQNSEFALFLMDVALEKMGIDKASLPPVVLSFINKDRNLVIAQAIQKQWEMNLGIRAELNAVESKMFHQQIKQKEYQVAIGSWVADFNDPINFLEVFKYQHGSTNNTYWEDTKYIELLDRSMACRNQDERKQLLREAEEILMDQMPIIPLFHYAMNYLQRDGLSGVALSPIGQIDVRWARVDSAQPSHATR